MLCATTPDSATQTQRLPRSGAASSGRGHVDVHRIWFETSGIRLRCISLRENAVLVNQNHLIY